MSDGESLVRRTAELLDAVVDRDSFLAFLDALSEEREAAESLERERPEYYAYGGALNWQNSTISSYLAAASVYFGDGPNRYSGQEPPSWRDLARFLRFGKIYE